MGLEIITVITQAADSYDLVQLEDMKLYQGIASDDTQFDAFISSAITRISAAIQNYCNRAFVIETISDSIWPERDAYPYQVPGNIWRLNLSRWPVTNMTSLTSYFDPTTPQVLTEGDDYLLDAKCGQIVRLNQFTKVPTIWEPAQIAAIYQAGYAAIPADIQDICFRMIASELKGRGRDPMLRSITERGVTKEYWVEVGGRDGYFPPDVTQILDMYRVPRVG